MLYWLIISVPDTFTLVFRKEKGSPSSRSLVEKISLPPGTEETPHFWYL